MLFMKEKRQEVIKECTLKESAAINQILGKMVSKRVFACIECVCACKRVVVGCDIHGVYSCLCDYHHWVILITMA